MPQSSVTIKQSHSISPLTQVIEQITNNKSPLLLVIGITILVLVLIVGNNIVVLVSGNVVGHLLSISMNQVALVLLGVVSGADSPCHDASVEAIYLALVAGEDVLRVVCTILV
jgi:Na+/H+ antiporter NhaC